MNKKKMRAATGLKLFLKGFGGLRGFQMTLCPILSAPTCRGLGLIEGACFMEPQLLGFKGLADWLGGRGL